MTKKISMFITSCNECPSKGSTLKGYPVCIRTQGILDYAKEVKILGREYHTESYKPTGIIPGWCPLDDV